MDHNPADLHPDLRPYLTHTECGMEILSHPLVQQVPYFAAINHHTNELYAHKLKALAYAEETNNLNSQIFLRERPYRVQALAAINSSRPEEFWPLLGQVWTDSENIWQNLPLWRKLWSTRLPDRHLCMDEAERATLEALPATIRIFRGVREPGHFKGLSWTTDEAKARWFANRFSPRKPTIYVGSVRKRHVLAHFLGRGESELVVLPQFVSMNKTANDDHARAVAQGQD